MHEHCYKGKAAMLRPIVLLAQQSYLHGTSSGTCDTCRAAKYLV